MKPAELWAARDGFDATWIGYSSQNLFFHSRTSQPARVCFMNWRTPIPPEKTPIVLRAARVYAGRPSFHFD